MRSFSKKLACVVASAAMVVTMFPAAKAQAAEEFALNRTSAILYVNEGADYNAQVYDFNFAKKPANYLKDYTFAWATDKAEVATVKAGGIVTAVGVGKAKISCVVTDKATKEVAATVTADVTVKANAKTVFITNADEFDGLVFEAGETIDLNRSMTDENGNVTSKRGKYVTDLTRWVAEPATGVEINQSNGQYTFTDEATGEYELYCETYQSDKHPEATAKSEPVKVTVNNNVTFDVKQTTTKKFTINFDSVVKTLNTADITVTRLFETAAMTYEYPQVVNKVELAKDGKSASVEVFSDFVNGVNYSIKVTGFEPVIMKASVGTPATMTLSAKNDGTIDPFIVAGKESEIFYRLYDANGVDVTSAFNETVIFNVKEYSTDGSYYVAGNKICFLKDGLTTTVTAEYQGRFENGVQVGKVSQSFDFISVAEAKAVFGGVASATVTDWKNPTLEIPFDDFASLKIKVQDSAKNVYDVVNGVLFDKDGKAVDTFGTVSFDDVTPNVAALNKDTMEVVKFKQGTATFVVNLVKDGKHTPVGSVSVVIKPSRALSTVAVDKSVVTVGTVEGYDKESFKLILKDQYGADCKLTAYEVKGANALADGVKSGISVDTASKTVTIKGSEMQSALDIKNDKGEVTGQASAVQLTYTIKVNKSKDVSFSVLVKRQGDNPNANYVVLENSAFGDIARKTGEAADMAAKSVTVTAFVMSNGIKIDELEVSKYDENKISNNQYYFKVTKNGADVTASDLITVSGGSVTINFSDVKTNDAVSGSVVTYNELGAGNYVVALYKGMDTGSKVVPVQQQYVAGVATLNPGSYTLVSRISETYDKDILKCFSFKNTKGEDVKEGALYTVKATKASAYTYVESVTFYDKVATDVYAEYTVNIGVSLKNATK